MKTENTVAKVLKAYSVINFIACVVLAATTSSSLNLPSSVIIIFLCSAVVVNFMAYAIGEVVQILHDIRNNTSQTKSNGSTDIPQSELPDF